MSAQTIPVGFSLTRDIHAGVLDTARILRTRWASVRSTKKQAAVIAAFLGVCFGLISAANMGLAVKTMAMLGRDTAAGIYATSWIVSLQRNEIGDIGAITLGGALIAALFAPFTGSATLSLVPTEDLAIVRPARLHRYFDALLINAFSGIGLLQLMTLTGITSVLTLDRPRAPALCVTWLIWLSVILLATTIGWALEWATRRFGRGTRTVVGAVALVALAAVVLPDTDRARRLFGFGETYARWMRDAADGAAVLPAIAAAILALGLLLAGCWATQAALTLPAARHVSSPTRRLARWTRWPLDDTPRTLLRVLWRTPECRRPLIAMIALGIPAVALTDVTGTTQAVLMLAVPLALSLTWTANVFGAIGPGMPWLYGQPRLMGQIPRATFAIHVTVVTALVTALCLVAFARGHSTSTDTVALMAGGLTGALLSGAISVHLAVRKPIRARLAGRGDSLIPPLTALGYLILLGVSACIPAAVVTFLPGIALAAALGATAVVALAIQAWTEHAWGKPAQRAQVTAVVAAE